MSDPISHVVPGFQMVEMSREVANDPARPSSSRRTTDTEDPTSAFDYLWREPRHARRLRHALHIMVGVAMLVAVAGLLCAHGWPFATVRVDRHW